MGIIAAAIAASKGRNAFVWFIAGFIFSFFAVIVVLFMPDKKLIRRFRNNRADKTRTDWRKKVERECPYCGSRVSIDDIPGNWTCPNCGKAFIYSTDGRTYKIRDDQILPPVELMIKLFAKLAKADGVVTENEVRQVDTIVRQAFQPNKDQLRQIMSLFNETRYSGEPFEAIAWNLYDSVGGSRGFLRDALTALLAVAAADGALRPEEESMLLKAAEIFGLSEAYASIKARFFADSGREGPQPGENLEACYRLLGCSENESDDTIKKKYRRLIKENHPDRLVSSGASEESIKQANKKVAEIKRAYEQIMAARA
ncbi:molecular chaperone DnaJ [Sporolactobacillus sp. THM7-4]|nr:molecular chaperone DnaJ [Sporolactobacillus sp. THM7-4]